jgi:hypothetical protein
MRPPTGDQYDVREGGTGSGGDVRNLGKPVSLAERYFREGADEISFLNITGFRDFPLEDLPMLEVGGCCASVADSWAHDATADCCAGHVAPGHRQSSWVHKFHLLQA